MAWSSAPLLLPPRPMIWISILLVSGALALIGVNLTSELPDHQLGASLLIRGRLPWLLLLTLWGGIAFAVTALFRGRVLPKTRRAARCARYPTPG